MFRGDPDVGGSPYAPSPDASLGGIASQFTSSLGGGGGAIGGLVSGAIGGGLNYLSQASANSTAVDIARETNAFNERMMDKNIVINRENVEAQKRWQEQMSNTAWQRAVSDMKAAGINPMLAFSKGGASTPSGGLASSTGNASGNTPSISSTRMGDSFLQAMSTAMEVGRFKKDMQEQDSRISSNKAATLSQLASAKLNTSNAKNVEAQIPATQRATEHGSWTRAIGRAGEKISETLNSTASGINRGIEDFWQWMNHSKQKRFDNQNNAINSIKKD